MAVEAVLAWYQGLREAECLQKSMGKQMASITKRLNTAKDLSEAEVAKLMEERRDLQKRYVKLDLEVPPSPRPDLSGMTEAERAATAEKLRRDEVEYALSCAQESPVTGPSIVALARMVDFDPKQDGRYYSRFTLADLSKFDLDEESPVGPMRYINSRCKNESDFGWLSMAVNFLSVKIGCSDVGYPIRVYGTIIVRDSVDLRCVYLFRRCSDDCQLINSEAEPMILTGPKRGIVLSGNIYLETDLKMKDDLVQDRELSKGLMLIRNGPTGRFQMGYATETRSLATRLSTVDVCFSVVDRALEGTIEVEVVRGGFHGKITANTANMQRELVLYDSKEADAITVGESGDLKLVRPVVCVYVEDLLMIAAQTCDGESERIAFSPRINTRAEATLVVAGTELRVKLCWSVMNP